MALRAMMNYLDPEEDDDDYDDDESDDFYSQSALVQACFHGDPDEVRALLFKKLDVNFQVGFTSSITLKFIHCALEAVLLL